MAIVTKGFVKQYLGIMDTTQDDIIDAYIILCEQQYLDIRNAPWEKDDLGDIVYPLGSNITVASMIGYQLSTKEEDGKDISAERIGSYNVSYSSLGNVYGYPSAISSQIKKYVRGV